MKKLSGWTKHYFDQFIHASNNQVLHPLDWRRFYDFIYIAHKGHAKLSEDQVATLLKDAGFESERAEELATVYQHGRSLLKRKPNPAYQLRAEISRKR